MKLRTQVEVTVGRKVQALQAGYLADGSEAVRTLAVLRRGLADGATYPDTWAVLFADTPGELVGTGDEPSPAERAMQTALVLFAVHQQAQARPMHMRGSSLGAAVRQLSQGATDEATVRRFKALGGATSWEERLHHLRGLVTQLRGAGIPVDYGQLATDLLDLQRESGAARVRRRWGRDLHRAAPSHGTDPATGTAATTDDSTGDQL